jgi:protein-disulfide isomerase
LVKRILVLTLLVAAVGAGAPLVTVRATRAQVQLTLEPSMTKGAAAGPVTIVEFSDYQ